jgi:hypothetical protein
MLKKNINYVGDRILNDVSNPENWSEESLAASLFPILIGEYL